MTADLESRLQRLYAGAVYDSLRAMGHDNCVLPHGIRALIPEQKISGEIYTIDGHFELDQDPDETLLAWATVLSEAPGGKVLMCQPNTYEVALMGELSAQALMAKGVKGYIVDGAARDVEFLLENQFPTFCRFATPKDIVARWRARELGGSIDIGGVKINTGDYVLADLDGVVIVPRGIAEQVITATETKASTESSMRDAIIGGMDAVVAYKKFGVF